MNIRDFLSRAFGRKKQKTWKGPGRYMDSKEFFEDVRRAVIEGAKEQERYLNSMGKSFKDF